MAATITDISDAVVTHLNGVDFSQPFTAERIYVPVYGETETALKVWVLGLTESMSRRSRGEDEFDFEIKVAVYKRVESTDREEVDDMVELVEEISDSLRTEGRLPTYTDAALASVANAPIYDPVQLDKFNVFVSVVTATYKVMR